MRYLTDRKRAVGKGASGTGTEHHWYMTVSAVGLAMLLPIWLYVFGSAIGGSHEDVLATFARPVPAVLTGLMLVFGMQHFHRGAEMMITDYAHGSAAKIWIMLTKVLSYSLIAFGLYALAKMAL